MPRDERDYDEATVDLPKIEDLDLLLPLPEGMQLDPSAPDSYDEATTKKASAGEVDAPEVDEADQTLEWLRRRRREAGADDNDSGLASWLKNRAKEATPPPRKAPVVPAGLPEKPRRVGVRAQQAVRKLPPPVTVDLDAVLGKTQPPAAKPPPATPSKPPAPRKGPRIQRTTAREAVQPGKAPELTLPSAAPPKVQPARPRPTPRPAPAESDATITFDRVAKSFSSSDEPEPDPWAEEGLGDTAASESPADKLARLSDLPGLDDDPAGLAAASERLAFLADLDPAEPDPLQEAASRLAALPGIDDGRGASSSASIPDFLKPRSEAQQDPWAEPAPPTRWTPRETPAHNPEANRRQASQDQGSWDDDDDWGGGGGNDWGEGTGEWGADGDNWSSWDGAAEEAWSAPDGGNIWGSDDDAQPKEAADEADGISQPVTDAPAVDIAEALRSVKEGKSDDKGLFFDRASGKIVVKEKDEAAEEAGKGDLVAATKMAKEGFFASP